MNQNLFKRFDLLFYYIITFVLVIAGAAGSYLSEYPIFSPDNPNPVSFLFWFIMAFSPTIAAAAITGINSGKQGLKELFSGYLKVKVSWVWYLAAIILLIGPFFFLLFINLFKGSSLTDESIKASSFFIFFLYNFFSGPASEEAGWRGFALPRMLKKSNALTTTLVQGIIWVVWHIPFAFVPASSQATTFWPVYATLIISINIILNWLWVNTKGSLAITVLAHFCFNFGSVLVLGLLKMTSSMTYNLIGAVLGTIYLLLIFLLFSAKSFLPRKIAWLQSFLYSIPAKNNAAKP